jgi:hypothetical protein
MTLEPISIATKGYVCNFDLDPIAIATKGYVCAPVPFVGGGGDSMLHRGRRGLDTSIDALLVREDEEVLAIIMAAARTMQWD